MSNENSPDCSILCFQFKDDLDLLNSLARDKSNAQMVHNINAENPQIREMHSENIRLRASLEDYQRALEHIMTKYREHSQSALAKTKINFEDLFRAETEKNVVGNIYILNMHMPIVVVSSHYGRLWTV